MNRLRCILIWFAAALTVHTIGGCANIVNDGTRVSNPPPRVPHERDEYTDHQSLFFQINRRPFSEKRQMEDITSFMFFTELEGFEGRGYIALGESHRADFELNVLAAQHYTIGLRMQAEDSVITLTADGAVQGAFYMKDADEFTEVFIHGIYLDVGVNRLALTQEKGSSFIDFLTVKDFELPDERFTVSAIPANRNASGAVRMTMEYFGEIFGEKVLLAQHVTPGTNTEIGAVFSAAGRLPAVRFSDLMSYSRSFMGDKPANDDTDLALEWAKAGGLVGYDWTWYSPIIEEGARSHYYAGASDFNLNDAFTSAPVAALSHEGVAGLFHAGTISRSCYELILELDFMAENLKRLRNENAVVLWRPLHQAGTRWFWWGNCEPESYIWLWRLMFERFGSYHGLDNLIWVWSGQDALYYPGDEYVDIIGEDIYNTDDVSNMPAFVNAGNYTRRNKFIAMTECGLLPSPDLLNRDGAMWLWTALYRGDFLIDGRGRLINSYNRQERLARAYNHELTVTLDKLPQIG